MRSNFLTVILGSSIFLGVFISLLGNPVGDYISGVCLVSLLACINIVKT
jgi:hypothetical protein